jgi:hypothetical protein
MALAMFLGSATMALATNAWLVVPWVAAWKEATRLV